ncbi:MAG TPA: LacI family DNA-binding transcriptional regulator [Actinomycetota bacterium]
MSRRRVSIKDVAREAGVSVTTVSHALNDKGRLHPDTRAHVKDVADRLGYRPNPAARSLVSGRAQLIAAMASLPDDPRVQFSAFGYYTELVGAASGTAVDRDYALVVAPPSRSGFIWDRVALDGVIVIDPLVGEPALPSLRSRQIPFVTVGFDPEGPATDAVVAADEETGTCAMLDHLAAAGGGRIGLLSAPPVNAFVRDTLACFERWCDREGREPIASVLDLHTLIDDTEGTIRGGLEELLSHGADAIYAPVELIGVPALRILESLGARVPRDVLLATTHDAGAAAATEPPLTALMFDYAEMGRRAASLLLDVIDGQRRGPVEERVPTWVSPRASTNRGGG